MHFESLSSSFWPWFAPATGQCECKFMRNKWCIPPTPFFVKSRPLITVYFVISSSLVHLFYSLWLSVAHTHTYVCFIKLPFHLRFLFVFIPFYGVHCRQTLLGEHPVCLPSTFTHSIFVNCLLIPAIDSKIDFWWHCFTLWRFIINIPIAKYLKTEYV